MYPAVLRGEDRPSLPQLGGSHSAGTREAFKVVPLHHPQGGRPCCLPLGSVEGRET